LAEPPALSPSTRKISVSAAFSRVQSVSLPGRRSRRVGDLRAVSRLSLRRSRSSARSIAKASRLSACAGSPASQWSNRSRSAASVSRPASGLVSF